MKRHVDDFFIDEEKLEHIRANEEKKKEKIRELRQMDPYNHKTKGSKILTYLLLSITFVSVICYFVVVVLKSKEILDQLTSIISASLLSIFAIFFLIQSLLSDNKKGRRIACISSLLLTSYSVFNILVSCGFIIIPQQDSVPNFAGKNLSEVVSWASSNNIALEQVYEMSDTVEEYGIISQDVVVGTLVKNVDSLTVVVSEGPNYDKEIIVPSFIGKSVDDVITFVDENFLTNVNIDFTFSDMERDQVFEQDKSGQMKRNDVINLVASLGTSEDLATVKMKDLVGEDTFHAVTWVKRFGFEYVLEYEYSDKIGKGYVLKQSIESGMEADPKEVAITLVISKGPKIEVVDLANMSVEEITEWVMENNLKIEFEEVYDEAKPIGSVVSVNVDKGDTIEEGALIKVVLSKGQLKMESFTSAAEFRNWAESYGITYKEEYSFDDSVSSGNIIKSSHQAGDVIKNTDTVIIYVSQGKSVEIPNFVGNSKSDISKKCSSLGLKCSFKYGGFSDSVSKDVATAQSKKKGSTVASGTSVTITLSSGKASSYNIVIQSSWLSPGDPNATISTLKSKLEAACPGVTFKFQKKMVNTGVGLITQDSPVKGGNNTFVQGKTYTFYIGSAS